MLCYISGMTKIEILAIHKYDVFWNYGKPNEYVIKSPNHNVQNDKTVDI